MTYKLNMTDKLDDAQQETLNRLVKEGTSTATVQVACAVLQTQSQDATIRPKEDSRMVAGHVEYDAYVQANQAARSEKDQNPVEPN